MTTAEMLKDEVESRVRSMLETESESEEWSSKNELERTVLEDILGLSAKDHGAMSVKEVSAWLAVQRAARKRLDAIKRFVNEVDIERQAGEADTLVLCTDCEDEGGIEDFATVKRRRPIPASCDRCGWREPT